MNKPLKLIIIYFNGNNNGIGINIKINAVIFVLRKNLKKVHTFITVLTFIKYKININNTNKRYKKYKRKGIFMKKIFLITGLFLMTSALIFSFSGCKDNSKNQTSVIETTGSENANGSGSSDTSSVTLPSNNYGIINYIADDYISFAVLQNNTKITDYTTVNKSMLDITDRLSSVSINSDTYCQVVDGKKLEHISTSDLREGDYIAISTANNKLTITILNIENEAAKNSK